MIKLTKYEEENTHTHTEGEGDARRKSLFDWPLAFTKVILIVANCTLA